MRFRHAPVLLLAAASLVLTAAAPATVPAAPAGVATSSLAASSSAETTADAYARAGEAIVAMTSGAARTGSAVVVANNLVVTSADVVKLDNAGTTRIMTVDGEFVQFKEVARDKRLGLVLLQAPIKARPIVWGKGRELQADMPVEALGIGTQLRELLPQKGALKSPAAATGLDLMITDIHIDPLVEGGALVQPDGKVVGIVVAAGQGEAGGNLGWAVTSEAVREFVKGVQDQQAAAAAEAAKRGIRRVLAWSVLLGIFAVMGLLGWRFRKWYKRMEAREEAAMAAAEEASRRAAAGGAGDEPPGE